MSYIVNPAKSALNNTADLVNEPNKINNICHQVSKNYDLNDDQTQFFCGSALFPHVLSRYEKAHKTPCNTFLRKPVIWNSTPSYFPKLFHEMKNVDMAYDACLQKCTDSECRQMCKLDADAIVHENDQETISQQIEMQPMGNSVDNEETITEVQTQDNSDFNFSVLLLITVAAITFSAIKVFKKN